MDRFQQTAPGAADAAPAPATGQNVPGGASESEAPPAPALGPLFGNVGDDDPETGPLWPVGDVTRQVLELYQSGRLEESPAKADQVARAALLTLVVTAPDGAEWSLGATTNRWYRRTPGQPWTLARPPAHDPALEPAAQDAVTRALTMLGVDPDSLADEETPEAPSAAAAAPAGGATRLLDSLVDGMSR